MKAQNEKLDKRFKEVATVVLNSIDHYREAGRDDGFNIESIAEYLQRQFSTAEQGKEAMEERKLVCELCKGSGLDTTITGFTAICDNCNGSGYTTLDKINEPEQGKEATPVERKNLMWVKGSKKPRRAGEYFVIIDDYKSVAIFDGKDFFSNDNVVTKSITKWLWETPRTAAPTPKNTDDLKQKYAEHLGVKNELDTSDADAVEWASKTILKGANDVFNTGDEK